MKKRAVWIGMLGAVIFLGPFPVFAAEGTAGDYFKQIGTKFGRGVVNVVTSPADIGCTIGSEMADRPAYGFFTGLGKGTLFMLRRILVGATEVGTFVIPMERTIPPVCQVQ